ncbi:MAG TPA: hypothetical protein DDZ51_00335 [Planctomycetaceae bacterium]|nr:hypothetical protein [Planctomycetaceae bacterium]
MANKTKSSVNKPPGFTYSLPAIRAFQAGQEYFTTAIPFDVLSKLIESECKQGNAVPLDRDRPKTIADYIVKNRHSYVLPALTVSIDGDYVFDSAQTESGNVAAGVLVFAINTNVRIHDGLYRALGIAEAVERNKELNDETIPVVIFPAQIGDGRRLGDIKSNQRKSGRSERIVSDTTDPIANITREVIANVPAFKDSIEMGKTTISNRSKNLFTFSALYQANEVLLSNQSDLQIDDKINHAIEFWQTIQDAMPDWTSETPRVDLRKQTVHAHGVTLCAIATFGTAVIARYPKTWKQKLGKLRKIDWSRDNTKLWEGKAMLGGRMTKTAASIELTSKVLWSQLVTD